MKRLSYLALVCLLFPQPRLEAASPVVISELMANNTRTLFDEDGDSEDWIEIHNVGTNDVNLLDWSLTDDPDDLRQWRFPATNLTVGGYMVIFASNKDRRVPGSPLHTNFRLGENGDYLALVEPDGTTIATVFTPRYPIQVPNVSFGFGLISSNTTLLAPGAALRVLVPTPGNGGSTLGDTWKGAAEPFPDGGWRSGTSGVGFSAAGAPSLVATSSMTVRFNFDAAPAGTVIADTKPIGTANNGVNNGATWVASSTDNSPTPVSRSGVMQFVAPENDQIALPANASFNAPQGTISFWMRSLGFFGPGQGPAVVFDRQLVSANLATGGLLIQNSDGRLQWTGYSNGVVAASATTSSSPSDDRWHHVAVVYDQAPNGFVSIYIDGVENVTVTNSRGWTWPAAQQIELGRSHETSFRKYHGMLDDVRLYNRVLVAGEVAEVQAGDGGVPATEINTNVEAEMLNVNSSAFLRLPFTVADANAFSLLTLRVRHNDGFTAWLNGTLVASVNAPDPLAWDSAATAPHASSLGDNVVIGNPPGLLRAGINILAIQGLNVSATDPTFLVLPELVATSVPVDSTNGLYFTQPTPGAANTGGSTNVGPAIADVAHLPNVPIESEDLLVSARLTPTFNAISNVTLRYRIMYGTEVSVPMNDSGGDGDLAAGDGLWSGRIPESASTNGQMIRYYITALDVKGNPSKWPLFYSPTNSEQYLGTIVEPEGLTSKLPIYHLFINPSDQAAADAENPGARCSIFYDGEFYDNVRIELRGNTSAGFRKKAHRIEFNRDHRFRHLPGYPRIGDTSFLGESADPAYLRQAFSFWLNDAMGVPSPFEYPVRLQLNTAFYQLALHSDVMGIEQLERLGYDPRGALYKAVGQVRPTFDSTGGFEKKTRLFEDRSDYLALANGIAESVNAATRATNVFDMLDVPNVINYLTVARWVQEADDVWANMTLYRDTEGDQLWRIVPFDMNVSWGQLYCGDNASAFGTILATNDNFKSHPLYGGQTVLVNGGGNWNRLYDVIVRTPETREMLLRRMRSLLDKFVLPPSTHPLAFTMEHRVLQFSNSIHAEAILDRLRWGWENSVVGGSPNGPYCFGTNVWVTNHTPRIINEFIGPRRKHWYETHSITNTARAIGIANANNAGIPLEQPTNALIGVRQVEFNPGSANQAEEFICLTNPNPYAVDISGWKLGGGVEFTFKGGTVLGSNKVLYVSPDLKAFRNRSVAPKGGMALLVVGPYQGQLSARGEPLTITDGDRLVYTNFYTGNPSLAQQFLRVTEIMYNPTPLAGNPNGAQEFEYIELKNISSSTTVSLLGVRFINGIQFSFTGSAVTSLSPGQRVLVVANQAAFTARYGAGATIAGQYLGRLDNAGERLQLVDSSNEEILDFNYNNSWYPATDGLGFSLVIADETANTGVWGQKIGWRPSGVLNGAPGQNDPPTPVFANIVVSEVLAHTDLPQLDAIELHNPTNVAINIGGWFLSDDVAVPKKYRITNGCVIAAGGYLSFDASLFNNGSTALVPFALSSTGDEVWLFSGDANTNLTGYVFSEDFGASANGVSLGRHSNSVGQVHFVAQTATTLGAANAGPRVGPVVISEIMYHPPDLADGIDNSGDEYVELQNITGAAVPLFDALAPANTWRVRGGIDYDFPTGVTLQANGRLLLVNFNTHEARKLADFRARYGVPPAVPIYGPYGGELNNSSDDLRLERPDNPNADGVPYIRVDRVEYEDDGNWPIAADGTGASLQRVTLSAYGNDPNNWTAGVPGAGTGFVGGTPPSITTQPVSKVGVASQTTTFSVAATGSAPLNYQWTLNGENIEGATSPVLMLENLQFNQSGTYNVTVFNGAGSVVSSNATLTILLPAYITQHPVGRAVYIKPDAKAANLPEGTNVTFTVAATTVDPPLSYQWHVNGVPIDGATGPSLTVNDVQLEDEGDYSCAVTDGVSTVFSANARLVPWLSPRILQVSPPPTNAAPPLIYTNYVPVGSPITFSAAISGNPPPFTYVWRLGSSALGTPPVSDSRTNVHTFNALATPASGTYRLIVTNVAQPTVVAGPWFAEFRIVTLADNDQDGIPDNYEVLNGLDTNNVADALGDLDSDGMNNGDEYRAGTDPNDSLSNLRVDLSMNGGATVHVSAVASRNYTVQYSEGLGSIQWTRLADIFARGTNRIESIVDPGGSTNRFYRVVFPQQP
jgi:hypothetical protein